MVFCEWEDKRMKSERLERTVDVEDVAREQLTCSCCKGKGYHYFFFMCFKCSGWGSFPVRVPSYML